MSSPQIRVMLEGSYIRVLAERDGLVRIVMNLFEPEEPETLENCRRNANRYAREIGAVLGVKVIEL